MENSHSQSRHKKKRLTQEQVRQLEKCFTLNKKLEPDLKLQLSKTLGLPQRQVAVWFQNKRARSKTQSLELQHCNLQSKLEAALSDKAKLEHQVQFLQDELKRSRIQLALFTHQDSPVENSHSQSRHKKKRLTQEQVRQLEKCFTLNKKLEPDLKLQLSKTLGLPQRQVAVWFQNKRARSKTQSLELQHCNLQSKLEAALSDKAKLEHQVQFLQDELKRSRIQLALFTHQDSPVENSNLGSCEEGHDDKVVVFDELYACFVTNGHGSSSTSWV